MIMQNERRASIMAWASELGDGGLLRWVLAGFIAEERTVSMERLLGIFTLVAGLWVLSPGWQSFGSATALSRVPELLTGSVMTTQAALRLWSLGPPVRIRWCRWMTLLSFGTWLGITTTFFITPPRTLLVVALTSTLTGANLWVWVRLKLLFAGRA